MSLNLYDILQEVITESVDTSSVINAIDNKCQVWINYSDEKNHAPGRRLIEPYVYGISMAGNPIIRAFLWKGDSFRGAPRYETLRLDRITSWQPRDNNTFITDPKSMGMNVPDYNENGDGSMSSVIKQVKFDDSNDLYQPSLEKARNQTVTMQNIGKINPNKTKTDVFGNMPYQQTKFNAITRQGNYNKIDTDMVKKNIADTQKTKDEWDKIWDKVKEDEMSQEQMPNDSGPIQDKHSN